jgi:hypothetical protein
MMEKILTMTNLELLRHLTSICEKPITDGENYVYYPSVSNLMLVSHVDTVRDENKPLKVRQQRNIIAAKDSVLGADDRAGVWAMMEIARLCMESVLEVPNLLFTNFEESGGRGMLAFISAYGKEHFDHINLVIALDRAGCNEYVTYNDLPIEVSRYMESFGFKKGVGIFNDIAYFTEEFRIPSVNISVGYYGAHTVYEQWHTDETWLTISRVLDIIRDPIEILYKTAKHDQYSDHYHSHDYYQGGKDRAWLNNDGGNGKGDVFEILESVIYNDQLCIVCEDQVATKILKDSYDEWAAVCPDCYLHFKDNKRNY